MDERNEIVRLAIDAYNGSVEKYSTKDSMKTLREALIEANNGSTVLDVRAIRDGKCNGLFSIVEEVLDRTVSDNLANHAILNDAVDFRNIPLGDKNEFLVDNNDLYFVARAADGTQAIRRQRPAGYKTVQIPTEFHVVKIYEELNRILAGRVDFNQMINRVSDSFAYQLLNEVYAVWQKVTANDLGGATYYVAGAYDEGKMLDLIAHVEAANPGSTATVVGTKSALRNLAPALTDLVSRSDAANDLYNFGYVGKFYGTPVVAMPQRHVLNTTKFMLDDKTLTVIAGGQKAIKCVYEGDPLVIPGDMYKNQDLTQDYLYGVKYGIGIITAAGNQGMGRYKMP